MQHLSATMIAIPPMARAIARQVATRTRSRRTTQPRRATINGAVEKSSIAFATAGQTRLLHLQRMQVQKTLALAAMSLPHCGEFPQTSHSIVYERVESKPPIHCGRL
jgi:hypothetical protein